MPRPAPRPNPEQDAIVSAMVADGRTIHEIADRLGVHWCTVQRRRAALGFTGRGKSAKPPAVKVVVPREKVTAIPAPTRPSASALAAANPFGI